MAQISIYQEGVRRLQEFELDKKRLIYKLDDDNENEHNNIIKKAIDKIPYEIIEDLEIQVHTRKSSDGFYMNWHIDDCAVFKHSKEHMYYKNNIKLNDKYSLYYSKVPVYTMIIYLNSINIDFTGGEFNFVDKKIEPEKYLVIFFDSREVHKVDRVRSGTRETILVKFYNK